MPWTSEDVKGWTKKADTPKKCKAGAQIANDELARCQKAGEGDCKGRAKRVAKAAIAKMGEATGLVELEGLDEEMQAMVALHVHGLKSALESERQLRKNAERQIKLIEPSDIAGDVIPLMEKSVRDDGIMPIKIIGPGWGTSGYYSPDVLERDGPKILRAGTKMFWDHPTPEEEAARPEGSLRNLAAQLAGDARWENTNPMGAGLYADAKVFSPFKDAVDELAPHIGVSIRGLGRAKEGEAEDREGRIIEEIAAVHSVDFVTIPGAGGQILQLFESARREAVDQTQDRGGSEMEELEKLQKACEELEDKLADSEKEKAEAKAESARLKEADLLRRAKDFVGGKLAEVEVADVTRNRLLEALSKNPPIVDGELDEKALEEQITTTVMDEVAYIAKVADSGSIRGMGSGSSGSGDEEADRESLKESYESKFMSEGKSPEEAKRMAEIAAAGR